MVVNIRPTGWRRQAPRLLAAAAVLAVVASLGAFFVERERLQDVEAAQSRLSTVLTAADAQDSTERLQGGGRLRVVSSEDLDQAVVVMADMPSPGEGRAYELWSVGDEGPVSEAVISAADLGAPDLHLIDSLDAAGALAITEEPAGGSPTGMPSTDPIVSVDLTGDA